MACRVDAARKVTEDGKLPLYEESYFAMLHCIRCAFYVGYSDRIACAYLIKEALFLMSSKKYIRRIVMGALLVALGVVLGGMLSIPGFLLGGYSVKIGLGTLPIILAGVLYGPGWGAIVGIAVDVLQALIFPKGAYIPFFTIVSALFGLIPGFFFWKKKAFSFLRLLLAIACGQLIGSVICNTALLMILYGYPFEIIIARIINQIVMIPLYTVLVYYILKVLKKATIVSEA